MTAKDRNGRTRWDYEWVPDIDDDNDYVWRNGYWECEEESDYAGPKYD